MTPWELAQADLTISRRKLRADFDRAHDLTRAEAEYYKAQAEKYQDWEYEADRWIEALLGARLRVHDHHRQDTRTYDRWNELYKTAY